MWKLQRKKDEKKDEEFAKENADGWSEKNNWTAEWDKRTQRDHQKYGFEEQT